ncbi:MAG: (2Fe-2S)-binding protein [Rhodospirillales bacterium]|nr:(2Fe-2S)-binding protein [Rhodospirillales bacterium]
MPATVTLRVNGTTRSVTVEPDTPLLYVLRNDLGLVGSRFGCGSGQCGACFVLVDGRPMASCDMPLWSAADKEITTLEGLGRDGELHPVQRALIAEQAAQCGYCMSGIAVSAAALLSNNPSPTEAQIREALDKHLCRCGSHSRVIRAVLRAANEQAR